jgi:Leucine-rich repeat (LRR) protein
VTLDHQPISDLSMLKDANISRLSIASTSVTDLSPLRGMKLTYLRMSGTKVTDLSPIQGMPITNVTMSQTDVHDLTPLIGMPLKDLNMPDCKQITDLSPLEGIKTLEQILLPPNAKNIELVRRLPNVRQIGFSSDTRKPADQFWAEYDSKRAAAAATQPGGG